MMSPFGISGLQMYVETRPFLQVYLGSTLYKKRQGMPQKMVFRIKIRQ